MARQILLDWLLHSLSRRHWRHPSQRLHRAMTRTRVGSSSAIVKGLDAAEDA